MNSIISENKVITSNLEKLLSIMNNTYIMRKLLFVEEHMDNETKILAFNLKTGEIVNENVPFIYHFYLLRIINLMLLHLKTGVDKIKKIILETFSQNYLLGILARTDHFTYKGT